MAENIKNVSSLEHNAHLIEEIEDHHNPPELIMNNGFQLYFGWYFVHIFHADTSIHIFLRDPFSRKHIL